MTNKITTYLASSILDIKRHIFHFCISTVSIFIVVLMALVVYSIIDKSPAIFLRIAEKNKGKIDLKVEANTEERTIGFFNITSFGYLNYTRIDEIAPERNFAPRKYIEGAAYVGEFNESKSSYSYMLFANNTKESELGISKLP